jgi:outer membrane lipoprotein-sorting protein
MLSRIAAPVFLMATILAASACTAQPPPAPASPAPQPSSSGPASSEIKTADDLLTRLESADKDLKSLTADLRYDRIFALAGDRQVRTGKLYYIDSKARDDKGLAAPGARKFAIQFTSLRLGDQTPRPEEKIMVFDGHWLIEKTPSQKQFIKREIVPSGRAFDPLRIGEGPFPVPVGQRREDILKRFNAQLLPAEEGAEGNTPADTTNLKAFVTKAKAYQLKLTPKPGPDQDFKEVRLWYAPDGSGTLLPIMARTVNQQDDISIVELANVKLNQDPPANVFEPQPPEGWDVTVEQLPAENRR